MSAEPSVQTVTTPYLALLLPQAVAAAEHMAHLAQEMALPAVLAVAVLVSAATARAALEILHQ